MTSKDDYVTSDGFDIPNSIIALDSNQSKSSLFHHNLCDNYFRETLGEPLSNALAYVIIYRPEDPIEFISNLLINWSHKTTGQNVIDHKSNNTLVQSHLDDQEEKLVFQSDKSHQDNSSINPKIDDKQESSNYFQEQKQHTHTHDTSTGFDDDDDDEMKNNQENNRNHRCQNGNLSSFSYFSKLRDKIIKCDES